MGYIAIIEKYLRPRFFFSGGTEKCDKFAKRGNKTNKQTKKKESGKVEMKDDSLHIFYSRIRPQPLE